MKDLSNNIHNQKEIVDFVAGDRERYRTRIPEIVIFLFTITTLSVFIFPAFIGTYKYLIPIVVLLVYILALNFIYKKPSIYKLDLFWLFSFIILVLRVKEWDISNIGYIVIYGSGIILIISSKMNIDNFSKAVTLIKIASFIFALSIIIQYFYIDSYMKYIYPYFTENAKVSLNRTLQNQRYAGIAHHVAYITVYISSGIGLLFAFWEKGNRKQKRLYIILIIIMFISLIFTGDRSTIVFVCMSLGLVYIISSTGRVRKRRMNQIIFLGMLLFLLLFYAINNYTSIAFFNRLNKTLYGLFEGEDISNGRSILYLRAWELFLEKPILGIGWEQFSKLNAGILIKGIESPVHNIYLQLLCETGIIGFTAFMIPIMGTYTKTYKLLNLSVKNEDSTYKNSKHYMIFSFYMQTLFLLEGIIGNSLYKYGFLLMYFLVCSVSAAVSSSFNNFRISTEDHNFL